MQPDVTLFYLEVDYVPIAAHLGVHSSYITAIFLFK